jgi:hypothetical protein
MGFFHCCYGDKYVHQSKGPHFKESKFACDQCQFKAGTKGMLDIYHNNLHQDIKHTLGIMLSVFWESNL